MLTTGCGGRGLFCPSDASAVATAFTSSSLTLAVMTELTSVTWLRRLRRVLKPSEREAAKERLIAGTKIWKLSESDAAEGESADDAMALGT